MAGPLKRLMRGVLLFGLAILLVLGGTFVAWRMGWLEPFGIESESHDSQVINAIERTQEVSLLSLAVQGIREESASREVFGFEVPGSREAVFLQYSFDAKLGIDGAQVTVDRTGAHAFTIVIPEFKFIGYDEPTFKLAVENGGVLSWVTPDIDKVAVVNDILNNEARKKYLQSNQQVLEDQTEVFYEGLIKAVDPDAVITFEFSS